MFKNIGEKMKHKKLNRRFDSGKGLSHIRFPNHKRDFDWSKILSKSITIKDIIYYGGTALVIILIVLSIFMAGRWSVSDKRDDSSTIQKTNQKTILSSGVNKTPAVTENKTTKTVVNITPVVVETKIVDTVNTTENKTVVETKKEEIKPVTITENKTYLAATFGYPYNYVTVGVTNPKKELVNEDTVSQFARLKQIKLTIVNNENVIINPTEIKIAVYEQSGTPPPLEKFTLPIEFRNIKPGQTVSSFVDVKHSFKYKKEDYGETREIKILVIDEFDATIQLKKAKLIFMG